MLRKLAKRHMGYMEDFIYDVTETRGVRIAQSV
jgi:hypothetical protein